MYYAGIGSRKTPHEILELMEQLAYWLADEDQLVLRSGHAPGADQAFERGAEQAEGDMQIFLPWTSFECDTPVPATAKVFTEPLPPAYHEAAKHHPVWPKLSRPVRALHARNAHQILGPGLDQPATFVICWTLRGGRSGGTGQALRIAEAHDIPIYDLGISEVEETCRSWVL